MSFVDPPAIAFLTIVVVVRGGRGDRRAHGRRVSARRSRITSQYQGTLRKRTRPTRIDQPRRNGLCPDDAGESAKNVPLLRRSYATPSDGESGQGVSRSAPVADSCAPLLSGMTVAVAIYGGFMDHGRTGGDLVRRLGVAVAAVGLAAGCGNGQSPTESGRLAEASAEARETPKPADVDRRSLPRRRPAHPAGRCPDCPLQGFWSGYPRGAWSASECRAACPPPRKPASRKRRSSRWARHRRRADRRRRGPGDRSAARRQRGHRDGVPLPRAAGCRSDAGCVQYRFAGRGLLMGARVVAPPGRSVSAYVHDVVGHGVLGLCHWTRDRSAARTPR